MRHRLLPYLAVFAALAVLEACSDSAIPEPAPYDVPLSFTEKLADIETHHEAWTDNDAAAFFAQAGWAERYIYRSKDSAFVRFSAYHDYVEKKYSKYYVIVPYSDEWTSPGEGEFELELPCQQSFRSWKPDPAANIMAGAAPMDEKSVQMHAAVGYLHVGVSASSKIKSVALSGCTGEIICGPAMLSAGYGSIPKLTLTGAHSDTSITLTVDDSLQATALDAVFCLPPLTFSEGIRLRITTLGSGLKEVTYTGPLTISRGKMAEVEELEHDIPIVYVTTPGNAPIVSKEEWITGASFLIKDTDGKLIDYGGASVKGRGNASWKRPKKSYSIKMDVKPKEQGVLGLPGHKRWCLIAVQWGYLGNNVGYELARRTASYKWEPSGRYVELVLNGEHLGTYFLAEQIRVDKNRVNIKDGYLLTYDRTFNDPNRFKSRYFQMPVMIKDPDEDELTQEQFSYIEDYINEFEASLADNARFAAREYEQYFDIDAYIDMWFVWEMAGATGSHGGADFTHPNSVWFYKDNDGKLTAGPCWDFDSYLFSNQKLLCNDCQYYGRLFQDPVFKARVKEKWPVFRSAVEKGERPEGNVSWRSSLPITEFIDSCYNAVKFSAERNQKMWTWTMYQLDTEYKTIREGLPAKLEWLEEQVEALSIY